MSADNSGHIAQRRAERSPALINCTICLQQHPIVWVLVVEEITEVESESSQVSLVQLKFSAKVTNGLISSQKWSCVRATTNLNNSGCFEANRTIANLTYTQYRSAIAP
jgi:hypothetical protein